MQTGIGDYERRIAAKKMRIVKKEQRPDGLIVLVSQGMCPKGDQEDRYPHYKVEYAIFRDMEYADLAEFYTIPLSPITTPEDRINTALRRADQTIKNMKQIGRYGKKN